MSLAGARQSIIMDHFRRPRNRRRLDEEGVVCGDAYNPMCGDAIRVWLRIQDGKIQDAAFDGKGCSISLAAASMTTCVLSGRDASELEELRRIFREALSSGKGIDKELGDLRALAGVSRFPSRVRCALLAFDAAQAAIDGAFAEGAKSDRGGVGDPGPRERAHVG